MIQLNIYGKPVDWLQVNIKKECGNCKYFIESALYVGEGTCCFDENNPCRVNTSKKLKFHDFVLKALEQELDSKITSCTFYERPGKPQTEGLECEFWEFCLNPKKEVLVEWIPRYYVPEFSKKYQKRLFE